MTLHDIAAKTVARYRARQYQAVLAEREVILAALGRLEQGDKRTFSLVVAHITFGLCAAEDDTVANSVASHHFALAGELAGGASDNRELKRLSYLAYLNRGIIDLMPAFAQPEVKLRYPHISEVRNTGTLVLASARGLQDLRGTDTTTDSHWLCVAYAIYTMTMALVSDTDDAQLGAAEFNRAFGEIEQPTGIERYLQARVAAAANNDQQPVLQFWLLYRLQDI